MGGFVLLNRFLDLTEAIDEGEVLGVDNTDFADTDIPAPDDTPLPAQHYLDEAKLEDTREWILSAAMDPDVSQEPVTRDFLREVHHQINDQLEHLMRRYDRNSL